MTDLTKIADRLNELARQMSELGKVMESYPHHRCGVWSLGFDLMEMSKRMDVLVADIGIQARQEVKDGL